MTRVGTSVLFTLLLAGGSAAPATEVWTGLEYAFTKAPFADWALEANQDRITDLVWITRKNTQGIFNVAQESGYQHFLSPLDTEWATGAAEDYESLTFADWETWNNGYPPGMLNQPAVVHLISDDIYLDIMFTQWSQGASGGGFAYARAVPEPGTLWLLGMVAATTLRRR